MGYSKVNHASIPLAKSYRDDSPARTLRGFLNVNHASIPLADILSRKTAKLPPCKKSHKRSGVLPRLIPPGNTGGVLQDP
jgi:hypothetical protein